MTRIASIHIYPVKSLRGFSVDSAEIDPLGLVGDRRFLVVDEAGRFLTQRNVPQMALVATALNNGLLHLTAAGEGNTGTISVPIAPDPAAPIIPVSVWSYQGLLAEDCGKEVAAWLSHALGTPCRLVRIGPSFQRPLDRDAQPPTDLCSFADGAPLLVASTASLEELNRRIGIAGGEPVPMDRFRPNLVITGGEPFAEDSWTRFHAGNARFRTLSPCERCVVTTADQLTGQRGKEPLKTLATFRRSPLNSSAVLFGMNVVQENKSGCINVGDAVRFPYDL
jgi:uncharacterized protein YcbX